MKFPAITVSSVPSPGAGRGASRDTLDQIRAQIRPDIWSELSRHMAAPQASVTASQQAELLRAGEAGSKRKKVDANANNPILCNMNQKINSHTGGGTSIVASIDYSKNNGQMGAGYAINGIQVPQRLYPYQALAIATACRQVLKKGESRTPTSASETVAEVAATAEPRAIGSRTLTVTVTNATAPALSTTYETSIMAGVPTLSSATYTLVFTVPYATRLHSLMILASLGFPKQLQLPPPRVRILVKQRL